MENNKYFYLVMDCLQLKNQFSDFKWLIETHFLPLAPGLILEVYTLAKAPNYVF